MSGIVTLLERFGPLKPCELARLTGRSKNSVRVELYRLRAAGRVVRMEDGRYAPVNGMRDVTANGNGDNLAWLMEGEPPKPNYHALGKKNIRGANDPANDLANDPPNVFPGREKASRTFDPCEAWTRGFYDAYGRTRPLNRYAVEREVRHLLVESGKPPSLDCVDAETARKLYLAGRKVGNEAKEWEAREEDKRRIQERQKRRQELLKKVVAKLTSGLLGNFYARELLEQEGVPPSEIEAMIAEAQELIFTRKLPQLLEAIGRDIDFFQKFYPDEWRCLSLEGRITKVAQKGSAVFAFLALNGLGDLDPQEVVSRAVMEAAAYYKEQQLRLGLRNFNLALMSELL